LKTINRQIFITSFLLFSIQVLTQNFKTEIDSILNLEIKDLKTNGIKEIGYTKVTCLNFGVYSTAFLFWKEENSTFIQKFKNIECVKNSLKKFKAIEISDTFFNFYKQNKVNLDNENVEHFRSPQDSMLGNKIYSGRVTVSHTCFRHFVIKSNNENFHKQFNFFDIREFDKEKVYASTRNYTQEEIKEWEERGWEGMETEVIHENYPIRNINFEKNKVLIIVKWDEIMREFIEKIESQSKFKLIKL